LAGRHLKAIELLQQAAELVAPIVAADSISNFAASIVSTIYSFLAGANQHYGLYTEADRWARKAVDFGTAHNVLSAQATGFEFLSEDAIHAGNFKAGLEYATREFELIEKLQSRERKTWACFAAGMCSFLSGDLGRAEREFTEGLEIAEFIGERRACSLLKGNLAVVRASNAISSIDGGVSRQKALDDALTMALENFNESESLGLLYTRFEGYRCLAEVRFRRGEMDEAERLCAAATEFLAGTESRVCRLWLGPLYIDLLLAQMKKEDTELKPEVAATKRNLALTLLDNYQQLVAVCESPRFVAEAERLASALNHDRPAASPGG
jgi:tetratricopeptide (TPR) repeat protein